MKCPVCGAKLYNGQVCAYCKTVTRARIEDASNIKAKQLIKQKNKEEVVYSNVMPKDVNKVKLWLFTVLLGWLGIQNFYVGKYLKGIFNAVSFALSFIAVSLNELSIYYVWGLESSFGIFVRIFTFFAAITFLMWFVDVFSLLFKNFKVPVVLGEDTTKQQVKSKNNKK